ncbi:MAG: 2-oxoglutarate and iron-dependent oxygenase domain-containing protein [Methylobacteriaceae bacterium]|nr:2-oxoglutarate and iron-dependent oxygenase domain-containing protein [Methylobacteriaceae bacterium]
MTIPIIDLRNFAGPAADDHATARAIGEACERVGFFSIVNAGSHKTRSSQHGGWRAPFRHATPVARPTRGIPARDGGLLFWNEPACGARAAEL